MRVAIVSPNHTLRVGLRELLNAQAGIQIINLAASVAELESKEEIDVLVLASISSVRLSALDEFQAVLLLTDEVEEARALQSLALKSWGVIPLNTSEDELLAAVIAVGQGLWVVAPVFGMGLMRNNVGGKFFGEDSAVEALTARELEILQLLARGLANKQIAVLLKISEHTVKFHVSSVFVKLGVSGRTEAVSAGLRSGLISL